MMREEDYEYYVVRKKALPEVLLKVAEANRLLQAEKGMNIQKAAELAGISRSSYYKYKDDIFPFRDNVRGRTLTFLLEIVDIPGLLSRVLQVIADYRANLLTIHQTVPINGMATLTLSIGIRPSTKDVSAMIGEIELLDGVHELKILSRE